MDSKDFTVILASSGIKKCATLKRQKNWKNGGHHASRSAFFSPYTKIWRLSIFFFFFKISAYLTSDRETLRERRSAMKTSENRNFEIKMLSVSSV
jgi:hypothetical protein